MKTAHPRDGELALLAGGDLPWWMSLWLRFHVRHCHDCASTLKRYSLVREQVRGVANGDEVLPDCLRGESWQHLAAEMEANIRLGLSAGECVGPVDEPRTTSPRPAILVLSAYAALVFLAVAGVWLNRPSGNRALALHASASPEVVVFQSRDSAVEVQQGNRGFGLVHEGAGDVQVLVGAEGSVGARYVDAETGQMMIHHVLAVQ